MKEKERFIDVFLTQKIKIGKVVFTFLDLLFILALWILAFFIRRSLFPAISGDYYGFLEPWMKEIKSIGAFKSLGKNISNYTSPYMYLMCLVSGFEDVLTALKMISVVFDYIASIAMFLIIFELTHNVRKSILGMSILLLCPPVVLNSAYWCQCDVIYCTFLLFALYFFFKDNSRLCFIMVGISFSFKLQAVFILPFLIIMFLIKKTVKLRHILYIPATYLIMHIPAWIAGRAFKDFMSIYVSQADTYPWGTLEYPNIYAILDETIYTAHNTEAVCSAGTFLTIILLGVVAYYVFSKWISFKNQKIALNESKYAFNNFCITLALFTIGIIVYCLPHMHDRYGFMVDLLAIIYALLRTKKLPVLAAIHMVTTITYVRYLTGVYVLELRHTALIQFAILIYVGYDLYRQLSKQLSV